MDTELGKRLDDALTREFPGRSPFTEDAQRDKALEVIVAVAQLAAQPAGALRLYQAGLASTSDPRAGERVSVRTILDLMRPKLPVLAGGADRVGFARVLATVAAEGVENGVAARLKGEGVQRSRPSDKRPTIEALKSLPPKKSYIVSEVKPLSETHIEVPAQSIRTNGGHQGTWSPNGVNDAFNSVVVPAIVATATRAETGLQFVEGAISVVKAALDHQHTVLVNILNKLYGRTNDIELDALWWSQALYSPSLGATYRDIADDSPCRLLSTMASDLLAVVGSEPEPAICALFVETVRRLRSDIDETKRWADWFPLLLEPSDGVMPEPFVRLAKADATGLPVSAWLLGGEDPTEHPTSESRVRGRELVRRYFRERQAAAYISTAGST